MTDNAIDELSTSQEQDPDLRGDPMDTGKIQGDVVCRQQPPLPLLNCPEESITVNLNIFCEGKSAASSGKGSGRDGIRGAAAPEEVLPQWDAAEKSRRGTKAALRRQDPHQASGQKRGKCHERSRE